MKKIVWVSRHPMTAEQLADLKKAIVFDGELAVEQINPTWFATTDPVEDVRRNCETWRVLVDRATTGVTGEQPVVVGEFPSVALEALFECDFTGYMAPRVLTPVGRRAPELRKSLHEGIPFTHVRWVQLASMA